MSTERIDTLLKVLIGALLLIGTLRTVASFYEGFTLIGLAALLYLGAAVSRQLTTLNELLKYALFKQSGPPAEPPRKFVEADAAPPSAASHPTSRHAPEVQ